MLNPVNHTRTEAGVRRYGGEPYVVAGDVSSHPSHLGRGGWTWYTGSAGWLYRAATESLLGLRREGAVLRLAPCIPASWPSYSVSLRIGRTRWEIRIENPEGRTGGIGQLTVDGKPVAGSAVPLVDDGGRAPRARGARRRGGRRAPRRRERRPAARRAPEPPPSRPQPDVLVVDDDRALRDGVIRLLDDEGLSGVGAEDGAEALERLEAGLRPRLVIVDLEMPRMNGWAFVRKVEELPAFSEPADPRHVGDRGAWLRPSAEERRRLPEEAARAGRAPERRAPLPGRGVSAALASELELVLLDLVVDRLEAHAEHLRGLPLVAAHGHERALEEALSDLFERVADAHGHGERVGRGRRRRGGRVHRCPARPASPEPRRPGAGGLTAGKTPLARPERTPATMFSSTVSPSVRT